MSYLRRVSFETSSKIYWLLSCLVSFFFLVKWTMFFPIMPTGSNPIYNLLPDILGKLSIRNLKRESFCNIMQFLIASIKKVLHCLTRLNCQAFFIMMTRCYLLKLLQDKQMEALVEKLCNRFNGVTGMHSFSSCTLFLLNHLQRWCHSCQSSEYDTVVTSKS